MVLKKSILARPVRKGSKWAIPPEIHEDLMGFIAKCVKLGYLEPPYQRKKLREFWREVIEKFRI